MNLFLQKMMSTPTAVKPEMVGPITNFQEFTPKHGNNPFMLAMNTDSKAFETAYGKNQPLDKPMFLGYDNNRALYGGARLFVLY